MSPPDRPRIIVGGFLGLLPAGGVTWDYVQYPAGFAALGYDVYYIEDTRLWPVYQAEGEGVDCSQNVAHLKRVMDAFGLSGRWAYRDEASGICYGLTESQIKGVCASADIFVNISCSTFMREEYRKIPVRVLIDSDPMFTQIQLETQAIFTAGEPGLREMVDAHTHHFTFGENVGSVDCRIPVSEIDWIPTRQPVLLERWPMSEPSRGPGSAHTTVMNWAAGKPLEFRGEAWGQKNMEFERFMGLPRLVPEIPLSVVVGQTTGAPFPSRHAEASGWTVLDPRERVPDWRSYREFIRGSRGEFSIAKETYVKAKTGWFSCRSACFLAAGRPVVTQETGWSRFMPTGEGLFAFTDEAEAVEALRQVEEAPSLHARGARRIAEEYFDSRRVLGDLLARCQG